MLKIAVRSISDVQIRGGGKGELTDGHRAKLSQIKCTYHGDIRFPRNPITFEEAADVFQHLSEYLSLNKRENGIEGVPKKVYLYPLHWLDSRAARLVRSIRNSVVLECDKLLQSYQNVYEDAQALQQSTICSRFPGIRAQLKEFCSSLSTIQSRFQSTLLNHLPNIREGGVEESVLTEEIVKLKKSSFDETRLQSWFDAKKLELKILETACNE